jgi:long-subunit acyl-CoA synthetase (AMP-forming)
MKEFLDHNKVGLTCEDVYFSFLPLAHIFDRCPRLVGAGTGSRQERLALWACAGWQAGLLV